MTTQQHDVPQGAVEQTKEKGQELVSQAQEQVQQKTSELRDEAGARFREQFDQRSTEAGEQVAAVGQALRRGAVQLRQEGNTTPARAIEQAAEKAESLGGYLRSADADRILRDIEGFARRRPWLTAATGLVAGFAASRFVKASSERRYESNGYRMSREVDRPYVSGAM